MLHCSPSVKLRLKEQEFSENMSSYRYFKKMSGYYWYQLGGLCFSNGWLHLYGIISNFILMLKFTASVK